MTNAHEYAQAHGRQYLDQLKDLLRIPSVSTLPERKADMERSANWLAADMRRVGLKDVAIMPTGGHPLVFAQWLGAGPSAPTLLIYGHYDVQPAEMVDGWHSEPFEPVEKDGLLYARGSSDDKGQMFAHIKAIESMLAAEGKLPINVKLLVEGEEEIASENLSAFIHSHVDLLKADVCVISDGSILGKDEPAICYSLRGMSYMEVHVQGPAHDLHSGGYGGTVHNPAQALAEIIASLHNPDGSVNIPGFYDDVLALSEQERSELAKTNWTDEYWRSATGAPQPWGEEAYNFHERTGARPTLEVNGLLSGFTGSGAKTVLPAKAMAKISCRLVANQNSHKIYELVRDHIAKITPPTVTSEVKLLNFAEPALVDINDPTMQAAITAYERGWGSRPKFVRGGGTLPVVVDFQQVLGLPVILLSFGLETDGAHGPDEKFDIDLFYKGIDTSMHFYEAVAQLKK